jgi:hypothetical protein
MKFHTGDKTIKHDGKLYDPDTVIDLPEADGGSMGLCAVQEKPDKEKGTSKR